jgi:nicotinamide-nucleotide amidase
MTMELDFTAIAAKLGKVLLEKKLMLGSAESCTGGLVAGAMTGVAGSSQWFERGFVTYSNLAKQQMLGVSARTLAREGAVSAAVVSEMAAGVLKMAPVQVAIAISGIAGPAGGSANKPVGLVYFAWALPRQPIVTACQHFQGDREQVRVEAVRFVLEELTRKLGDPYLVLD